MSDDSDIPQDKSRQVVGNLQQRNASSVDLPSTEGQAPTTVTPISFREHSPVSGMSQILHIHTPRPLYKYQSLTNITISHELLVIYGNSHRIGLMEW